MPAQPLHTQTVENLLFTAEELTKFAEEIRAVAERMKLLGITEMEVTHEDQRKKSVMYADNFAAAARNALRERLSPATKSTDPKRVRSGSAKPAK
jgi:hypothetical protein